MSARYLLVDGHSVIFAWPELRALHDQNRAAARQALEQSLRRLHDSAHWRVTLVLDGRRGSVSADRRVRESDMVVIYASLDQTADSIIERLVSASGKAPEILVVTADQAERLTVESLGAFTASPAWLRTELNQGSADLEGMLNQVHGRARWR